MDETEKKTKILYQVSLLLSKQLGKDMMANILMIFLENAATDLVGMDKVSIQRYY